MFCWTPSRTWWWKLSEGSLSLQRTPALLSYHLFPPGEDTHIVHTHANSSSVTSFIRNKTLHQKMNILCVPWEPGGRPEPWLRRETIWKTEGNQQGLKCHCLPVVTEVCPPLLFALKSNFPLPCSLCPDTALLFPTQCHPSSSLLHPICFIHAFFFSILCSLLPHRTLHKYFRNYVPVVWRH